MRAASVDELSSATHYRTVTVDGLDIVYRDSGSRRRAHHSSPAWFSNVIAHVSRSDSDARRALSFGRTDYPGFGNSSAPNVGDFDYTFDRLADVIENFTDAIGLERHSLYVQDFGGPVGFRLATRRPERVGALIIQNANAYAQGLSEELRAALVRLHNERTPEMRMRASELFELPIHASNISTECPIHHS